MKTCSNCCHDIIDKGQIIECINHPVTGEDMSAYYHFYCYNQWVKRLFKLKGEKR